MNNNKPNNHCACNTRTPHVDSSEFAEDSLPQSEKGESMMKKILLHDCGKTEEYAQDTTVDELIADSVEYVAETERPYHSTAEFTMIPRPNSDEDPFNYQGS